MLNFKLCASNHGHHYIIPISGSDGFFKKAISGFNIVYGILYLFITFL